MRRDTIVIEKDCQDIDPNERRLHDLIEQFNDPVQQHLLHGIFKIDDDIDEIRTKQRQVQTDLDGAIVQLRFLRAAVDRLTARGRSNANFAPPPATVSRILPRRWPTATESTASRS